jgi:DNA-binding GntR family transcriptional regulator
MSETLPPLDLSHGGILSDEVYATIGAAILDGRLRPGQRLRDVELAAQLGISRTPVREALQRLERFGLVEIAVGRYTRVSEPDERLRRETADLTVYFMGNALRMSLAVCSDEQQASLLAAADAVVAAAAAGDRLRLFDASVTMFEGVTRATANTVFIGVMRETALAIQRNLREWNAFLDEPLTRPESYADLRDCIARRDGDGAEQALRVIHGLTREDASERGLPPL